jgi:hypothetical protein
MVRACIVTKSTPDKHESEAPVFPYHRLADDGICISCLVWQAKRIGGTGLCAERITSVFVKAKVAVIMGKIERRRTGVEQSLFNMSRRYDLTGTNLDAFCTSNTSCHKPVFVLTAWWPQYLLCTHEFCTPKAKKHSATSYTAQECPSRNTTL